MSKQNHALFINILKNAGPDFKFREELIQLHSNSLQLETSINLRRQIEYEYNKLKLEEVKERIDDIQFQKKYFMKRNNDILEDIQKRNLKKIEVEANKQENYIIIEKHKKKFEKYIDSLIPDIQTEFNVQLHKETNELAKEKMKELEILEKFKKKNDYYDKARKNNEALANEINYLQQQNKEANRINEMKKAKYLESQKRLQNQINNFKINNDNFDLNEYIKQNQNEINKIKEKNEEFSAINYNNKFKKDFASTELSLQELRRQIIKQNDEPFINTLNQNFEKQELNNDINNNINNKIKEEITPGEKNNGNINNDKKKKSNIDIQYEESNFNLLNSGKINDKAINNVNNGNNNKNSLNNINSDVNFILNNSNKKKNILDEEKIEEKKKEDDDDNENEFQDYEEQVI